MSVVPLRANRKMRRVGDVLVGAGVVREEVVYQGLAGLFGLPYLDISGVARAPEVRTLLPPNFVRQQRILPLDVSSGTLTIAVDDRPDEGVLRVVRFTTGLEVRVVVTTPSALDEALRGDYGGGIPGIATPLDPALVRFDDDAPPGSLAERILRDAVRNEAAEVLLEPLEGRFRVRFRVEGRLRDVLEVPAEVGEAIVGRLAQMAALDDSRDLPREGRARLAGEGSGGEADLVVSTLPTILGERVRVRIVTPSGAGLELADLGLDSQALADVEAALARREGLILVAGPAGSGVTTTLHAMLRSLRSEPLSLCSVEDPVEVRLPGVSQVEVDDARGRSFAAAIRGVLRQQPDVLLVGDVRDAETAAAAVRAARDGRLVLAGVSAVDPAAAIRSLLDLGVERFALSRVFRLVVAPRLVRALCPSCRIEDEGSLGTPGLEALCARSYRGAGCPSCAGTGTRGRLAIFEVGTATPALASAILTGAPEGVLRAGIRDGGGPAFPDAARSALEDGRTSLEEVVRALPPEILHGRYRRGG